MIEVEHDVKSLGDPGSVCVVIPAFEAAATVGRAVASALGEPEVREVLVVDDASGDATADAARAADDGSGRLTVHDLPRNVGPAAARNHAIALSTSAIIAILDADDMFVPGRLAALLAVPDWDIVGDNILFVPEAGGLATPRLPALGAPGAARPVDFCAFVQGNRTRRGRGRRELAFLHPLVRRDFLDREGLRYDETMRLGEDYDLYARSLAAGARFRLVDMVGYVALERANSLSGAHRTEDLARLRDADTRLLANPSLTASQAAAVRAHRRGTERRHRLRAFLDARRARGLAGAAAHLLVRPAHVLDVARGVARDKWAAARSRVSSAPRDRRPRTLFEPFSVAPGGASLASPVFTHSPKGRS